MQFVKRTLPPVEQYDGGTEVERPMSHGDVWCLAAITVFIVAFFLYTVVSAWKGVRL